MAVDRTKYDIVQVNIPKEVTPKLKAIASKHWKKMSPFILDLILKSIEEEERNSK